MPPPDHMAGDARPNILFLMTDQQRGDALGIENHPVLQTPFLDSVAASGVRFSRAYSACPICVAARRTVMTGQRPATHGVFVNAWAPLTRNTLPQCLADAGYQTHLVGKLHFTPARALYGFQSAEWADSPLPSVGVGSDYMRWLRRQGIDNILADAHGVDQNGWPSRPWHLDERYHFSNWCASMALDFLERRDPTRPFFLNVSFLHPHQPCTPPEFYYNRYLQMDLPEPYVGDWARVFDGPQLGLPAASWRTALPPAMMKQYRAAYYGSINHIDDQIARILRRVPQNTVVVFCSDHGEMLGDHQWIRKRTPYEPSARVPLLWKFPEPVRAQLGVQQQTVIDRPVELMDIMPTMLDLAGAAVPESVEGRSLLPLMRGESAWREYVHGECSAVPSMNSGMQYLTDGRRKYIWYPGAGLEQYFNLEDDPREMHELSGDPRYADEVAQWRQRLVGELAGRPEGFTDGRTLSKLNGNSPSVRPDLAGV